MKLQKEYQEDLARMINEQIERRREAERNKGLNNKLSATESDDSERNRDMMDKLLE